MRALVQAMTNRGRMIGSTLGIPMAEVAALDETGVFTHGRDPVLNWVVLEQVILSGQVSERELQELLQSYPNFKAWLKMRAMRRQSQTP